MDFKSGLDILWRRRMVVATAVVIGLVVAAFVFMITPTTYQATSSVMLVGVQNGRDPSMNNVDIPTLATSTSVLGAVQKDLKTNESISGLQGSITIKTPGWGVNVVPITFTDLHPRTAVHGANAVATELSQFYRQISGARYQQLAQYLNAAMAQKRARLAQLDTKLQTAAAADPYL
ncbi:MAG: Wzz/FepE/Etk N-terminal domain-containing protein, partial [Candidatus Eremiobacteraeota bacterium]|nr:Wzz/FepE/Etk N-terminal domain-containing protein [Candidatus Eremiobacteraeota bacterium]